MMEGDGNLEFLRDKLDSIFGVISYEDRKGRDDGKGGVQWYRGYDYVDDFMHSVDDFPHQFVVGSKYGVEMRILIGPGILPSASEWVDFGCRLNAAMMRKGKLERKARKAAKKAMKTERANAV